MPDPAAPAGPLAGIQVIDISHQAAGPWCTTLLGDMGADVWKVEKPGRGDGIRYSGGADPVAGSYNFWGLNRNKKSIAIDIKAPEGRDLILELLDTADVLVENFRPGVMERLGLGDDVVRRRNSRLVYASISAFGRSGPLRDAPGMDLILQATSGLMGLTGFPGGPPVKAAAPVADIMSGTYAALGIASALFRRASSGTGQRVDVNMLESALSLLSDLTTESLNTGNKFERFGSGHPHLSPYQAFEASDGYVVIACLTNAFYKRLMIAIDRQDLIDDPRFATNVARCSTPDFLAVFEPIVRAQTCAYWLGKCAAADVPACLVNDLGDVFDLEQIKALDAVVEWAPGDREPFRTPNVFLKFSDTPGALRVPPPRLGAATDEILQRLGRTPEQIQTLRERGVCGG
jgi:crotonobetainyl-CoA:carnitine CoA-transferase CaiB-like acyl-CoA transferase